MSYMDFSIECAQIEVRFSRKHFRSQMIWSIFCAALLAYDWSNAYNHPSFLTTTAFGCMIVNCLWTFMFCLEAWQELKQDKARLARLREANDIKIQDGMSDQYKNMIESNEQIMDIIKKTYCSQKPEEL